VDEASHRHWRRPHEEAPSPLAGAVPGAYEFVDECVGLLMEKLDAGTTLLVLSDHGFREAREGDYSSIDLDLLLERMGYLRRVEGGGIDWSRTRVFSVQDSASDRRGLYVNLEGRESSGIVESAALQDLVREVIASFAGLRSSRGEPIFRGVMASRSSDGPDIEIIASRDPDRSSVLGLPGGEIPVADLLRRTGGLPGAHDPAGILVASGSGIAKGRTDWAADLFDVFPTVLYLMGLPLPEDLPGRPIDEILVEPVPDDYPTVTSFSNLPPAPQPLYRSPEESIARLEAERGLGHVR
jgi:predicted AlkP superfamily phosphohydrolase/phosphomutase